MTLHARLVRGRFPALSRHVNGRPASYLDGPGGTQVPQEVIDAMSNYMRKGGSNLEGPFVTSRETEAILHGARAAVADLINAEGPDEISFGQNMTSITIAVSRALARTWSPGDEVLLTRLDHDANISPWIIAARERDVRVRFADFDPDAGCVVEVDEVRRHLNPRTKLVAVTHASNAVGSVVDMAGICAAAHEAGALVYVDAVHYAAHNSIDVQASGCDFLTASAYKFFGPHTGVFYGRRELLEDIESVKVRAAPDGLPGKWETGTQSFESLAGVTAAVEYIASLAPGSDRRTAVRQAMGAIHAYEGDLSARFLSGLAEIDGVKLVGKTHAEGRTPTFAVSVGDMPPHEVAERLGEKGIFVWAGHHYAIEVMRRLGVLDSGGLVRIGLSHYTLPEEVDIVIGALDRLAAGADLENLPEPAPF